MTLTVKGLQQHLFLVDVTLFSIVPWSVSKFYLLRDFVIFAIMFCISVQQRKGVGHCWEWNISHFWRSYQQTWRYIMWHHPLWLWNRLLCQVRLFMSIVYVYLFMSHLLRVNIVGENFDLDLPSWPSWPWPLWPWPWTTFSDTRLKTGFFTFLILVTLTYALDLRTCSRYDDPWCVCQN